MDEYLKEALSIVKAQAGVRNMTEEEMTSMVQRLSSQFRSIAECGEGEAAPAAEEQKPAVDPKKAIKENSVVCLECGAGFKVLSKKHIASHGLTSAEYRQKWGYKKTQSLVAKSLARQRRKKMQEMQLWKRRKNV
ncbi:transcriptional regulator [candidate division MSBL1 archaeon SCGC-AAA385M11]|nr:transcriptional regulator [candidate division MSBL1 archaeon SCGC-AAA385M11]